MREYELTYLVSDDVLEKDLKAITDRVAGVVADEGGKVSKEESWGRRKLTYPIKKQNFATYITIWFELPKEKINDLEHELRVHPQIIRHLIVAKIAKGKELVVTKEDVIDAEDVEKIIGEKSFEVVEGQKEESYDLMAKRLTTQTRDTQIDSDEKKGIEKTSETKSEKVVKVEKIDKKEPGGKPAAEEKIAEKPAKTEKKPRFEPKIEKLIVKQKKEEMTEPAVAEPKSDNGDAEADRIKKLDEKLDELLKDDL